MSAVSADTLHIQYVISGSDSYTWKPLRILNLYRLTIASLFLPVSLSGYGPTFLGKYDPALFRTVALLYLGFGLISAATLLRHRPVFHTQVYTQIAGDILALTLLMHASGAVGSGLGVLLVVAVAGGSILMPARMASLFAAIATLAILSAQAYFHSQYPDTATHYTQAAILGVTVFGTALLANITARRGRENEALAAQRGIQLYDLERVNEYIVQHMQSGIVVVDNQERIRLMNESAWYMLGLPITAERQTLQQVAPDLAERFRAWKANRSTASQPFRAALNSAEVQPRFVRLGRDANAATVIFLEDTAVVTQKAQEMKLASLGRLAANISHEIRNPLGAISHAAQLLAESPSLNKGDRRLTEIIRKQTRRMNTIVENVLQLSRREQSRPETIELKSWLEAFVTDFVHSEGADTKQFSVDIQPLNVRVHFDPHQLQQVLWNLCRNGLRHGGANDTLPKLALHGGITPESPTPFLNVIDNGSGVEPEVAKHLFEPFFTTHSRGTGLGLYISRELCESNQARLNYIPVPSRGSCFRITFADSRRQMF
jgi:Signal transduction histidine kinase